MCGGMEVQLHAYLISVLDVGEWSASCPIHFTPRESVPSTHWIEGWLGPRAGMDAFVKRNATLIVHTIS
jgi:hypothetical protein